MDQQKKIYNACLGKLRPIKSDIGRLQQLMDQNQKRMQKEFESWYNALRGQVRQKTNDEIRILTCRIIRIR